MSAHQSAHRRGLGLAAAAIAVAIAAVSLGAQSSSKYATWADLETWTRSVGSGQETEIGLGLHPSPSGTVLVSFTARFPTRTPSRAPAEIQLLGAVGAMVTPNVLRTPTLVFTLDEGTDQKTVMDLASKSTVDDPAPGAPINNIVARLTPAQLVRLTEAKTIKAAILGFPTEFRPDQLKALQAYARQIMVTR
jgi:hypothetical protein